MEKKRNDESNDKHIDIATILFFISLLYYGLWLIYALRCAIFGIDSGWAMPAMSDGSKNYGLEGFCSGIAIGILYTVEKFWFIPLYQLLYLISAGILKIVKKAKKISEKAREEDD